MTQLKKNSEYIRTHITKLKNSEWMPESQKFWPDFLYHFTDINNAIKILNTDECLFSRNSLEERGQIPIDSACAKIIASTESEYKNYVRLYFRPRTPTQFSNEGIRTEKELPYEAHCPVPVFFIFNATPILSQEHTKFSNGNLGAKDVEISGSVSFYQNLPFEKIFHDKRLPDDNGAEKKNIIFHRHAEVMVPKALDLSHLRFISCRSKAEFQTLTYLLNFSERHPWNNKIGIDEKSNLFFSRWLFIQDVSMDSSQIKIEFNQPKTPYPILMKCLIKSKTHNQEYSLEHLLEIRDQKALSMGIDLKFCNNPREYEFTIWLDGNLAYQNSYYEDYNGIF